MADATNTTPAADGTKLCPKCRVVQPTTAFAGDKNRADKLARVCRSCDKVIQAEYRERKKAGALIRPRATNADGTRASQAAAEVKAAKVAAKAAAKAARDAERVAAKAAKAQAKLEAEAAPQPVHVETDAEARQRHAALPQSAADVASPEGQATLEAAAAADLAARRLAARDAKRRQRAAAKLRQQIAQGRA